MRRRGGASGQPVKGRRHSTVRPKARKAPTAHVSIANLQEQLDRRTRDLDEALEQQTATAEILSVISNSPTDTQPVFDAIVQSGLKLFPNATISVALRDGDIVKAAAIAEPDPARAEAWRRRFPNPLTREYMHGTAILDRQIVDIADVREALTEFAAGSRNFLASGYRAITIMPMMRGSEAIGALSVVRLAPGPLSDKQLTMLRTFAAQAVIAIENTRLLNELRLRTDDLSESLQQQTATSDVLKVISRSTFSLQTVLDTLTESAARLCEADMAAITRQDGTAYYYATTYGFPPELDDYLKSVPHEPGRGSVIGRTIVQGKTIHVPDVLADAEYTMAEVQKKADYRTVLGVPLLREGNPIGVIVLIRRAIRPFTDKQIELVTTFADQAVIAIENVRLFEDVQKRTQELSESLEQQTATSEVLKVISSSPGELEPVFETMLENAVRICGAKFGNLWLREGNNFRIGATYGAPPAFQDYLRREPVLHPDPRLGLGRMIGTKETYQIFDIAATPPHDDKVRVATINLAGARTLIGVPMLKDNEVIGAIAIYRQEVRPFTDKQIELVTNFAAQAVIAIENVRLLKELRESLQQQTATADVLKVISRSTFDLQTVLATLVESATRLCAANRGVVFQRDGDLFRFGSSYGFSPEAEQYALEHPLQAGRDSVIGRAALEGKTIHIPDVLADPEYKATGYQKAFGYRTNLGVPLLREGTTVGVFALTRDEVNPFTEKQIELATTFADQAVIAIENVRLFDEVQARTRDLTESLQQQTATADVLKVISRSTFDLQTVLDTLIESAARLCDADQGTITRQVDGTFYRAATHGFSTEFTEQVRNLPVQFDRGSASGRALVEGKIIHIPDVQADPDYTFDQALKLGGFRTALGVPMLREGTPIGVLSLTRHEVRPFTDKQIELVSTFADQAAIAIENVRLFESVEARTRELAKSLVDLRTAQDRLAQTEKLASLGQLTAGIAHEIKNPLNFVNNFSAISVELIDELRQALAGANLDNKLRKAISEIADTLQGNLDKVVQHGKRADAIVKNMLLHSRQSSGERRPIDINTLVEESLNLAYHGARAEKQGFNITLERSFDPAAGEVDLFPQEITRVLLNFISNGFYAATKRKAQADNDTYEPTLTASTRSLGDRLEIRIRDNGTGITSEVKEKMFNPFFTTKPVGEGTGLGLSISHDIIVKQHGGSIEVDTQPGEFTEFRIVLPRWAATIAKSGERP